MSSGPAAGGFDYDVAIAGGGLAGATLALALARERVGLRIAVIEPFALGTATGDALASYQPSYDARSTAMSWSTRQYYQCLGIWDGMSPRATPIKQVHVSEQKRFGSSRMSAAEHDQPALGYVVDNAWTGLNLQKAMQDESAIDWLCPAKLTTVESIAGGVTLGLEGREGPDAGAISAALLVVADGGRSGLREKLGFQVEQHSYDQVAVIANVSTGRPHDFEAFERFLTSGPVAMLPRGNPERAERRCSLVWTLPQAEAARITQLPPEQFLQALQQAFGWRLGRLTEVGERSGYPLVLQRVLQPLRPHIALVGNAAHTLHPVAGQGFNLAIRGLMRLSNEIARAVRQGQSPGELAVLERYWQAQAPDVETLVAASGALVNLFSGSPPAPVGVARNLGLVALELVPPARRWFGRQAMGLGRGRATESVQ